jgi:hypothetical protein
MLQGLTVAGRATGIFYLTAMVLSRINSGKISEELGENPANIY